MPSHAKARVPGPGRQFRTFFLAVCLDIHERNGWNRYGRLIEDIGVTEHAVKEFEKDNSFPTANLDRYAAAYAALDGLDDGRELFSRALEWWMKHGKRPLRASELQQTGRPDALTPQAIIEMIRRLAEQAPAGSQPISTRRSRVG